jgi:proteasome accessory factor C
VKAQDQAKAAMTAIPFLAAHPEGVPLVELQQMLGMNRRQVFDVLKVVNSTGPGDGLPDVLMSVDLEEAQESGIVYLDNAEFLSRPLNLSGAEAISLLGALEVIRDTSDQHTRQVAERVIAKLGGLRPVAVESVSVQVSDSAEPVRDVIDAALRDGHAVRLDYRGPVRASAPLVDPVRRFTQQGAVYLQAYKLPEPGERTEGWRTYRADRIVAAQQLEQLASAHGPVPEPGVRQDAPQVSLTVAGSAAWVGESYPNNGVTKLPDGSVQIRMPIFDPEWFARLLLRLGSQVLEVDPPEAADLARSLAAAALHQYAS